MNIDFSKSVLVMGMCGSLGTAFAVQDNNLVAIDMVDEEVVSVPISIGNREVHLTTSPDSVRLYIRTEHGSTVAIFDPDVKSFVPDLDYTGGEEDYLYAVKDHGIYPTGWLAKKD